MAMAMVRVVEIVVGFVVDFVVEFIVKVEEAMGRRTREWTGGRVYMFGRVYRAMRSRKIVHIEQNRYLRGAQSN
jgi:hypothetical protein